MNPQEYRWIFPCGLPSYFPLDLDARFRWISPHISRWVSRLGSVSDSLKQWLKLPYKFPILKIIFIST